MALMLYESLKMVQSKALLLDLLRLCSSLGGKVKARQDRPNELTFSVAEDGRRIPCFCFARKVRLWHYEA